jgi:pimeloyl-ACP methyl ester carboxylesterase
MPKPRFRFRGESQILNADARSSAPGKFTELSDGITHYEIAGPSNGETVVLVHGFSVPYYIWDPTFDALVEAGFQVLRYDLYGRGYSDRPDTDYNQDLFDRQLLNLLSALNIDQPVDLIGLSMGGPISVVFADRHPTMVRKLCLIDPVGFPGELPFAVKLMQVPLLGEWLMSLLGDKTLVSDLSSDFYGPELISEYQEKYRPQMKYQGFKRALLSTLRNGLLNDMTEIYRRVGKQKRPVLLIWGREDRIIPFDTNEKLREAIPHAEFQAVSEAGHVPHYEQPEVVNPLLIEFLMK